MKSVSITGLLLFIYGFTAVKGFLDKDSVLKDIVPHCYDRRRENNEELINGQALPVPNTIEAFIGLVEKVEQHKRKIEDVVKILLTNFRYDDLVYKNKLFQSRQPEQTDIFEILKQIFNYPGKQTEKIPENILTEDERCALYFMISHTVNGTIRPNDETVTDTKQKEILKYPREQGVLSLGGSFIHAFAIGKVLLGLYAGFFSSTKISANSIFQAQKANQKPPEILESIEFDPVFAATFGDLIAISAFKEGTKESTTDFIEIFLPNGYWNEADCPTHYNLRSKEDYIQLDPIIHTTYSSIRGAVDGYILGKIAKNINQNYRDIRLSQVLRSYYSDPQHALTDNDKIVATWTERQAVFRHFLEEMKTEGLSYTLLCSACKGDMLTPGSVDTIKENVNTVFKKIENDEDEIFSKMSREVNYGATKECETDNTIFAIMDFKTLDENILAVQREIVGNLTSGLKMSRFGSSASLYTNYKPLGGDQDLDTIINSSTLSGCTSCALKYLIRSGSILDETTVLRNLNRTLGKYTLETEEETAVPAKIVLYFNNGNPRNDDQFRNALWDLQRYNTDIRVLAFGRKESMRPFVRNERDIFPLSMLTPEKILEMKRKICKIPAQFQYQNCYKRTGSDELNNKYEGFITPNNVQYWAMYPKYFLKSYNIKLTFKALQGHIKVCFTRYYEDFEKNDPKGHCQDTSSAQSSPDNSVTFYTSNPCKGVDLYNCRPFLFYIEGKTNTRTTDQKILCTDERCKIPDQISFEFTHEGISCNKGSRLGLYPALFYSIMTLISWLIFSTK